VVLGLVDFAFAFAECRLILLVVANLTFDDVEPREFDLLGEGVEVGFGAGGGGLVCLVSLSQGLMGRWKIYAHLGEDAVCRGGADLAGEVVVLGGGVGVVEEDVDEEGGCFLCSEVVSVCGIGVWLAWWLDRSVEAYEGRAVKLGDLLGELCLLLAFQWVGVVDFVDGHVGGDEEGLRCPIGMERRGFVR
jgi:hypothetical protein